MSKIEYINDYPLSAITLNPINPRLIREKKFEQLKQSILDFPEMLSLREIVIDENGIVLGGNMRCKALKELKIKTTNVVVWKELSEENKKEFIIKDNANYGTWDWEILANQFDAESLNKFGLNVWQPENIIEQFDENEFLNDVEQQNTTQKEHEQKEIIIVEFQILDYPFAFELIKYLTNKGADIGALLIEKLTEENGNF
jgi:hypothetical protein